MPKDKTNSQLSSTDSRASPYSRPSESTDQSSSKSISQLVKDGKNWEDTICVICMDYPHNAILLMCSSHEKRCRPYMCDTSPRHSNCFDQYKKTSPIIQTSYPVDEVSLSRHVKKLENKLPCPLCRGQVNGYMVVEAARSFMNAKSRSCALESCDFIGTYKQLRKHARRDHPLLCPTDTDPTRQQQWSNLVIESAFQELLGIAGSIVPYDYVPEGDAEFFAFMAQQIDVDVDVDDLEDWERELDSIPFDVDVDDLEDGERELDSIPFDASFLSSNNYLLSEHEGHVPVPPMDMDLNQSQQLDINTRVYPVEQNYLPIDFDLDRLIDQIEYRTGGYPSVESNFNILDLEQLDDSYVPINLDLNQSINQVDDSNRGNSSERSEPSRD